MKKQYCCSNFLFQEYNETSWIVFYLIGTSIGDAVRRCSGGWLFSCNDVISGPPFWAVPIRNVICYLADLLDKKNKCLVSHGSFQYCPRLGWLKKKCANLFSKYRVGGLVLYYTRITGTLPSSVPVQV